MGIKNSPFDFYMLLKTWQWGHSTIVDNALSYSRNGDLYTLFLEELKDEYVKFCEDNGMTLEEKDVNKYSKIWKRKKKTYKTYNVIIKTCLWNSMFKSINEEYTNISDAIYALWEKDNNNYDENIISHFFYMACTFDDIREKREEYNKERIRAEYKARMQNRESFSFASFSTWYEQKRIEEENN